jgi:purine-nucleoside phosphorylase
MEFDDERTAIINPEIYQGLNAKELMDPISDGCLFCFSMPVLKKRAAEGGLEQIGILETTNGNLPIFLCQKNGYKVAVMHPQVGAPLSAVVMEYMIFRGCKKFVIVGGAGSLVKTFDKWQLVIATSAVRDEGLSYHYLPPSREVTADPEGIAVLESILNRWKIPYEKTKTWTTDAIFRETEKIREIRVAEGCSVVEMEAAAFYAVAKFRGVQAVQLICACDLVVPEGWEFREVTSNMDTPEIMFEIGIDTVIEWCK